MAEQPFAMVRCAPIVNLADLEGQERHGRGVGPRARVSHKYDGPRCVAGSVMGKPLKTLDVGSDAPQLALTESLAQFMDENDAQFYGNAKSAKCLHLIVGVSPSWVAAGGEGLTEAPGDFDTSPRNPKNNERIEQLLLLSLIHI